MLTFDEVRAKIALNFSKTAQSRSETSLIWERETVNTQVTTDNRFRISRKLENGTHTYWASWIATPDRPSVPIGGRFMTATQAKDAVEFVK